MFPVFLQIMTIIVGLSSAILLWQIMVTDSRATKVLCVDVLSVQCLALTFLLAFQGLGDLALQFGLAIALLGFISTLILAHLIKP